MTFARQQTAANSRARDRLRTVFAADVGLGASAAASDRDDGGAVRARAGMAQERTRMRARFLPADGAARMRGQIRIRRLQLINQKILWKSFQK